MSNSEDGNSIVNFHKYSRNNNSWSLQQMLEDALAEVKANPDRWNKGTVTLLNDKDDSYQISWWARAMRHSEIVLLCHRLAFLINSKWAE